MLQSFAVRQEYQKLAAPRTNAPSPHPAFHHRPPPGGERGLMLFPGGNGNVSITPRKHMTGTSCPTRSPLVRNNETKFCHLDNYVPDHRMTNTLQGVPMIHFRPSPSSRFLLSSSPPWSVPKTPEIQLCLQLIGFPELDSCTPGFLVFSVLPRAFSADSGMTRQSILLQLRAWALHHLTRVRDQRNCSLPVSFKSSGLQTDSRS